MDAVGVVDEVVVDGEIVGVVEVAGDAAVGEEGGGACEVLRVGLGGEGEVAEDG